MKKILLTSLVWLSLFLVACSNKNENKPDEKKSDVPESKEQARLREDSLAIMKGHDEGMDKYGRLISMQNEAQRMLDSIAALPAKARDAAAPLRTRLEGVLTDLKSAKEGMDSWMSAINMDSALNNMELRLRYFADEKLRVSKMKDAIMWSLQKADSVIRAKL